MQLAKRPKHVEIAEHLAEAIAKGEYHGGDRLPSENELVERFNASRPTVARAMRELQHAGLIERRVGSGTYVREAPAATAKGRKLFGLLIPELGRTEIFEPICGQIARQAQALGHALVWCDCGTDGEPGDPVIPNPQACVARAQAASQHFIEQHVAGVFYAPVEYAGHDINLRILRELETAGIPVVLLDRDVVPFPERSRYDLIGVDNPCGGFVATQHLLSQGRKRVCFFGRPGSAPTLERRVAGHRDALFRAGLPVSLDDLALGDPLDPKFVREFFDRRHPDAFVCGNDIIAASLMQTLFDLGIRVPKEVAVVGFDDVKYARLLAVPLTTMRQPCDELGQVAVTTLLERIANPQMPARTVLLQTSLVVRKSCGAAL